MLCIKLTVQLHCPAVEIKSRCQKQSSNRGTGGAFVSGDKSGTLSRKRANTGGSHAAGKSTGTRRARKNQLPARISFSIGFRKIETQVQ